MADEQTIPQPEMIPIQTITIKEHWYQSRRIWAAIFAAGSAITILFVGIPYIKEISAALAIIAGTLSTASWTSPK